MKHVSALIFPATEPSYHILSRFLIFFKTLSCYRVMEPEEAGNNDDNLFPGLYSGYTPAPLGKDLLRFKRLLQEMETGRADEFARLFSIAKAPMAGGRLRDRDETSSAGIFSALHRDDDTEKSIRHQEDLWQARLILKLAEMFDRKEEEVRQGLEQISAAERKVFASLEGPGENKAGTAEELPAPNKQQHPLNNHILPAGSAAAPSQALIPIRLKAWARLYLEDNSDRLAIILAAQGSQSGSILLDGYENIWRKEPLKLFSLPIPDSLNPDRIKNRDHYLMARNTFREEIKDHLDYFAKLLRKTSASAEAAHYTQEDGATLTGTIAAWEKRLKIHFPAAGADYGKLDFYSLPGVSFSGLFQHLFHLEKTGPANKEEQPTAILAVLTP